MSREVAALPVSMRAVAIPSEHGGWGFTLEPVILGLLVSPGWAGVGLGVAALTAFLVRHPLRLWLTDTRRGKRYPRTALAGRVAATYGAMGLVGLVLAIAGARGPFWWPLVLAAPLAAFQIHYDARNMGRSLLPETSGAVAMGSVAAGIALAGGASGGTAAGLWLVLAVRAGAALVYARAQVMRARGAVVEAAPVLAAVAVAVAVLAAAAARGLSPWLSVVGMALLLAYSAVTLARPPVPARVVGWSQMAFGLLMVLLTAAGVRAGL
jgi:hypothetical protein